MGGITAAHPVGAEIVRDVEHLYVRITEFEEFLAGGVNVGAVAPGTASAVQDDGLLLRQRFNASTESFPSLGLRAGADVLGTWNVRLRVKHSWPDVKNERLNLASLQDSGEFLRLYEGGFGGGLGEGDG